jgi:predicted Rossmann fold nucleotide-binding protein DprA/Smf involved in DNA uptake
MTSKFEKTILDALSSEPVTPNELSSRLNMNYKTVQNVLLQLALKNKEIHFKNSGRIQLFWKEDLSLKESPSNE